MSSRITIDWADQYRKKGVFWAHSGNPKQPHVLIRPDRHSSEFFDSEPVLADVILMEQACFELVKELEMQGLAIRDVNRVVGPAMGAITLAHEIAYHIATKNLRTCLRSYTEKQLEGDTVKMVFKRAEIKAGEHVLLVEDSIFTGLSIDLTADTVTGAGGVVLPFVVVLVNRSGLTEVSGRKIVALVDHPMIIWTPDNCPLCREGSEAIRHEGAENRARLNASY